MKKCGQLEDSLRRDIPESANDTGRNCGVTHAHTHSLQPCHCMRRFNFPELIGPHFLGQLPWHEWLQY